MMYSILYTAEITWLQDLAMQEHVDKILLSFLVSYSLLYCYIYVDITNMYRLHEEITGNLQSAAYR